MRLGDWLNAFRETHEKSKQGTLSARDLSAYRAARDELARALLAAQHLTVQPGQQPRRALRVARALQANLEFRDGTVRALTQDISAGGFSALIAKPPQLDEEVVVTLRIPGQEPVKVEARVNEVKPLVGNARVSFVFQHLAEALAERVETFVFDAVLAELQK
ncbi:MAG TPA: PilZ domain-containing protein [Anaeromyxobacteraceae bacterium]|nr:PilZ domain-containing protein [Anaeromyxobacteraceae bacterium]